MVAGVLVRCEPQKETDDEALTDDQPADPAAGLVASMVPVAPPPAPLVETPAQAGGSTATPTPPVTATPPTPIAIVATDDQPPLAADPTATPVPAAAGPPAADPVAAAATVEPAPDDHAVDQSADAGPLVLPQAAAATGQLPVKPGVGKTIEADPVDPARPSPPTTTATAPASKAPTTSGGDGGRGRSDDRPARDGSQTTAPTIQSAPRTEAPADTTAAAAPAVSTVDRERLERLIDGLAARLKLSQAGDGARVRMHLEPRELGELVIRLEIRDGIAQASLITDNRDAGRYLQGAIADLRSGLADRGVQLDRVDVRVAGDGTRDPRHQAGQPQHQHGHRHGHRAQLTFGRLEPLAPLAHDSTHAPDHGRVSILA